MVVHCISLHLSHLITFLGGLCAQIHEFLLPQVLQLFEGVSHVIFILVYQISKPASIVRVISKVSEATEVAQSCIESGVVGVDVLLQLIDDSVDHVFIEGIDAAYECLLLGAAIVVGHWLIIRIVLGWSTSSILIRHRSHLPWRHVMHALRVVVMDIGLVRWIVLSLLISVYVCWMLVITIRLFPTFLIIFKMIHII